MVIPKQKKVNIYYDVINSPNMSFLKLAKQLKSLNVKNYKFFLKTYDKDLLDVDPFDPNLSQEMKAKVAIECKRNFWYFARRCVRIPVSGGTVPFELHIGNLTMMYLSLNNVDNILILPRQNFKTGSLVILFLWLYLFGTTNSEFLLFHKKLDGSQDNLARIMAAREQLPDYLQSIDSSDRTNMNYAFSNSTKNKINTKPSAKDKVVADQLGRGVTTPVINFDEFGFQLFNNIIYKAASPAVSKAREMALLNGKPAFKSITTTPGDLDTPHGEYAKIFFDRALPFDYKMFDMSYKELQDHVATNSKYNGFVYAEFSYKQIGRDEEYFKRQCVALDFDWSKINREVLLMWQRGSDLSPFTKEELELMNSHRKDPIFQINVKDRFKLDIYKNFNWQQILFLSCDMAGGCGTDNTVIQVIHKDTLEILAEFRNNMIDTDDARELIKELMIYFFPKAITFIERNNVGKSVLDTLMKDPVVGGRIYWEYRMITAQKKIDDVKKDHFINQKTKVRYYGINTTTETRPIMIDLLRGIVRNDYKILNSKYIMDDISGLIRKTSGKIEHSNSSHDDSVFAYLITRYAVAYGTNLAFFINKLTDNILSQLTHNEDDEITQDEITISNTAKTLHHFNKINMVDTKNNFSDKIIQNIKLEEEKQKIFEELSGIQLKQDKVNDISSRMSQIFKMN